MLKQHYALIRFDNIKHRQINYCFLLFSRNLNRQEKILLLQDNPGLARCWQSCSGKLCLVGLHDCKGTDTRWSEWVAPTLGSSYHLCLWIGIIHCTLWHHKEKQLEVVKGGWTGIFGLSSTLFYHSKSVKSISQTFQCRCLSLAMRKRAVLFSAKVSLVFHPSAFLTFN